MSITKHEIETHLAFNPDDGKFYRKHKRGKWKAGEAVGNKDTYGHIQIWINSKRYLAHRLAWTVVHGEWPKHQIDHINCNRSDNRPVNLRPATPSQNSANSRVSKVNTLGVKGVTRHGSKFKAKIVKDRKMIYLGLYSTKEEAHAAYVGAAIALFGEYARRA